MLSGQPSTILQPNGITEPVNLSGLGDIQLNWTSAGAISASILCGNVHKSDVTNKVVETAMLSEGQAT